MACGYLVPVRMYRTAIRSAFAPGEAMPSRTQSNPLSASSDEASTSMTFTLFAVAARLYVSEDTVVFAYWSSVSAVPAQ